MLKTPYTTKSSIHNSHFVFASRYSTVPSASHCATFHTNESDVYNPLARVTSQITPDQLSGITIECASIHHEAMLKWRSIKRAIS